MAAAAKGLEAYQTARAIKPKVPKVRVKTDGAAQKPVATCLIVVIGAGFLHAWLVEDKSIPDRRFFIRTAILGFVLALMTDVAPKVGKGFSYLILTAVVFERSQDLLEALSEVEKVKPPAHKSGPGASPLTPAAVPVTLYVRSTPLTNDTVLPNRPRIKKPKRGAAYQNII